jgi:hypothetical protein
VQQCDLVLIDEAHLIPRSSNTMYRRFLDGLKRFNPLLKVIGFTATPYRLDSGLLHEGDGAIFTDIAFEVSVRDLIDQGYLSRLVSKRMARNSMSPASARAAASSSPASCMPPSIGTRSPSAPSPRSSPTARHAAPGWSSAPASSTRGMCATRSARTASPARPSSARRRAPSAMR